MRDTRLRIPVPLWNIQALPSGCSTADCRQLHSARHLVAPVPRLPAGGRLHRRNGPRHLAVEAMVEALGGGTHPSRRRAKQRSRPAGKTSKAHEPRTRECPLSFTGVLTPGVAFVINLLTQVAWRYSAIEPLCGVYRVRVRFVIPTLREMEEIRWLGNVVESHATRIDSCPSGSRAFSARRMHSPSGPDDDDQLRRRSRPR